MNDAMKNNILLVDDEKANLVFLTRVLGSRYNIYTAKDGTSAIKKAVELVPDLVILDVILPDISGYEVLNALKKHDVTCDIPIIIMTGLSSIEEEEKALAYNAVDYINKPLRPNIVMLRVRNQMRIVNQIRTIERLSMTDQLTEIPNRRNFDSRLNTEWRRAMREKTPIGLLMLDIDHFKNYNDAYGHQKGDLALRAVARTLSKGLKRPGDLAARWGGEEFAGLLPNTNLAGTQVVAENIRASVERLHDTDPDLLGSTPITISIGAWSVIPEYESSLDAFISAADDALYQAKKAGRNRVCVSGGHV